MNAALPLLGWMSVFGFVPNEPILCAPHTRPYACQDLTGENDRFALLVDQGRSFRSYRSSGAHGTMSVIDLETGVIREHWPAGLGCDRGRKKRRNDDRSPEGIYHLVQRRKTRRGYKKRKAQLGRLFFLTSYPTFDDCAPRWSKAEYKTCRRVIGSHIGLHSGRRMSNCTNGCIRLTGTYRHEEKWIARLDERYIKGRITPLIIAPRVHDSFYRTYPTLSECWRHRLKRMRHMTVHNDIVALMRTSCEAPRIIATSSQTPPPSRNLHDLASVRTLRAKGTAPASTTTTLAVLFIIGCFGLALLAAGITVFRTSRPA